MDPESSSPPADFVDAYHRHMELDVWIVIYDDTRAVQFKLRWC